MSVILSMLLAISPAQQAAIKNHFYAQLLDGPSTRWKWPANGLSQGYYCGWLNAKNRFGAYTGWTGFVVLLGERSQVKTHWVNDVKDADMYKLFCSNIPGYDYERAPID